MASSAQPNLRFLLILLALVNLWLLAMRLWPLQEVFNLPLNGATGIDPAVCLLAYIAIMVFIVGNKQDGMKQAFGAGTMLGLPAGIVLVAEILMKDHAAMEGATQPSLLNKGLFAVAAILWGLAGMRGAQAAGSGGMGLIGGAWSAMVSSLMAATAVLAQMYYAGPPPVSQDPWKQYEGLAIGNPATQALVQGLNSVTFFLLVGPLAGAAFGLAFSLFAPKKSA